MGDVEDVSAPNASGETRRGVGVRVRDRALGLGDGRGLGLRPASGPRLSLWPKP